MRARPGMSGMQREVRGPTLPEMIRRVLPGVRVDEKGLAARVGEVERVEDDRVHRIRWDQQVLEPGHFDHEAVGLPDAADLRDVDLGHLPSAFRREDRDVDEPPACSFHAKV